MASTLADASPDAPVNLNSTSPSYVEATESARVPKLREAGVTPTVVTRGGQNFALIEELRQLAKQADSTISSEDPDSETLDRFLRASDYNLPKSCKMYVQHRVWRTTFVPKGYISEAEIPHELSAQKVFLQLKDGERPVLVIHIHKHDAHNRDLEEFKRFAVYGIDKLIASLPAGESKFGVILDFAGSGFKNMDTRAMIATFDFLQAQYPERLGRLFMVHVPYIFWGFWKVVSPFVDKVTRDKIVFVEDKVLEKGLTKEIMLDLLPREYGGKGSLVLIDKACIPDLSNQTT